MIRKCFLIPVLAVGLIANIQSAHADIVSAEFTLPNPSFGAAVLVSLSRGQSFTANESGQLTTVELQVGLGGDPIGDLTVQFAEMSGGLPGSTLATMTIPKANIPANDFPDQLIPVDFSSSLIDIVAGTQYAIILTSDAVNFPNWYLWGSSSSGNLYTEGSAFFNTGSGWNEDVNVDSTFRVSVAAIPEPCSGGFLVVGAVIGVSRRRR